MDFVPIHMLISNQLMDNMKLDWILKQLRLNGAIALSYLPLLLLMTHHEKTRLNALP